MIYIYRFKLALKVLKISNIYVTYFQRIVYFPNGGFSLVVKLLPGSSFFDFEKSKKFLSVSLKFDNVTMDLLSSNKVKISFFNNVSQELIPFDNKFFLDVVNSKFSVKVGQDKSGLDVYFPLISDVGSTVSIIAGTPGSGKSSLIKNIVTNLINSNSIIIWFDPKGGFDAIQFSDRVQVFSDNRNYSLYLKELTKLQSIIDYRNNMLARGLSLENSLPILLIVDEWALIANIGDNSYKKDFEVILRSIVATCRTANVSVILSTQRPTKDSIDVTTRELATQRICLSIEDKFANEAILGVSPDVFSAISLPKGHFIFKINGKFEYVIGYENYASFSLMCKKYSDLNKSLENAFDIDEFLNHIRSFSL